MTRLGSSIREILALNSLRESTGNQIKARSKQRAWHHVHHQSQTGQISKAVFSKLTHVQGQVSHVCFATALMDGAVLQQARFRYGGVTETGRSDLFQL